MKLRNWILRQLADKNLIELKYDYFTDSEKEVYDYQQEELRKLKAGQDIDPPWKGSPSWNNPARFVHDPFRDQIWNTFWDGLNDEGKREYIKRHEPSPEDWYQLYVKARTLENEPDEEFTNEDEKSQESILAHYNLSGRKEDRWLFKQKKRLEADEELEPPWIKFPISLPNVGWDDYFLEKWKLEVWIPFWEKLSEEERKAYLKKWQPPNSEWRDNITRKWVGKIKKTEDWFERQKLFLKNQKDSYSEPILFPLFVFQEIPAEQTFWDEDFIDRWMQEIWLPYWNNLSDEEQDGHLKYIQLPNDKQFQVLANYKIKNLDKFKR